VPGSWRLSEAAAFCWTALAPDIVNYRLEGMAPLSVWTAEGAFPPSELCGLT
jgi:hypothetical protein